MFSLNRGFTLVELLIVVVIISTLASVGLVGWGNLASTTRDNVRGDDAKLWASTFELYRGRYAAYPVMPTINGVSNGVKFCLGTFSNFNNKCGAYTSGSSTAYIDATLSSDMRTLVGKIGKIPENSGGPVRDRLVGPFVFAWRSTSGSDITITARFINFFERTNCPKDFTLETTSLTSSMISAAGVSAIACSITKTYTYNPN
jgi:prepilin-type N-terminal cleavage/methylation domain-containing protein